MNNYGIGSLDWENCLSESQKDKIAELMLNDNGFSLESWTLYNWPDEINRNLLIWYYQFPSGNSRIYTFEVDCDPSAISEKTKQLYPRIKTICQI